MTYIDSSKKHWKYSLAQKVLSKIYAISFAGMDSIPSANSGGSILFSNHFSSLIVLIIIQAIFPRPIRCVINRHQKFPFWARYFLRPDNIFIDGDNFDLIAEKQIVECLERGELLWFVSEDVEQVEEKIYHRYESVFQQLTQFPTLIPLHILSRGDIPLEKKLPFLCQGSIYLSFGKPISKFINAQLLNQHFLEAASSGWHRYSASFPPIGNLWVNVAKKNANKTILIDALTDQKLTGARALVATILLARRIRNTTSSQRVGVLLPMSAGGVLINLAILLTGKTVVNLNYTSGQMNLSHAITQASLDTIYTSHRFLEKLKQKGINLDSALQTVAQVIGLETQMLTIGKAERLATFLLGRILPAFILRYLFCKNQNTESPAALLFSSGSEGSPKGIQLSHRNIIANVKQIASLLKLNANDKFLSNLPLFHAFGLTATQFLPILEECSMICYADPTDVLASAKAIERYQATIMCATPTFLQLYCRESKINSTMLSSMRIIATGAEKMNYDLSHAFQKKFSKELMEGYGATETGPVSAMNNPYHRLNSSNPVKGVGKPLPGTRCIIVDAKTYEELALGEPGMILIGGPQVMEEYFNDPDRTARVIKIINGTRWYVTGDKGYRDRDGHLHIIDRFSRFAKIGGEMISLAFIEDAINTVINNVEHGIVVTNIPDVKRGERLVVLSDSPLDDSAMRKQLLQHGLSQLAIPSLWFEVESLPRLGTGKTDFVRAKEIAISSQYKGVRKAIDINLDDSHHLTLHD